MEKLAVMTSLWSSDVKAGGVVPKSFDIPGTLNVEGIKDRVESNLASKKKPYETLVTDDCLCQIIS